MKYLQSFIVSMGDNGCYFLCICKLGEQITGKKVNVLELAEKSIEKGYLFFNEKVYADRHNFYVQQPHKILELITGEKWEVRKESNLYDAKDNEFEIWFWAKSPSDAEKGIGHFTTIDDNLLQNSVTVATGRVYSKRIFKRV